MSHDQAHIMKHDAIRRNHPGQKSELISTLVDWKGRDENEMCKVYHCIVFLMHFLSTQSLNQAALDSKIKTNQKLHPDNTEPDSPPPPEPV